MVVIRGCGKEPKVQNFIYMRWISPEDIVYNILSIVNNTVLYTQNFAKRVNITLSAIITILIITTKKVRVKFCR